MNEKAPLLPIPEHLPEKFLKPYNPAAVEDSIYELWEKSGFFDPDKLPERNQKGEPFSIVLPPPNVTGTLHSGHALTIAIEDIMVRYARMQGKKALWIPGTDHAAIATQSKVEKEIEKKEGKRRRDFGREEFLDRVRAFAAESHDTIVNQVRKLGASVDWSREAFTLDEKRSFAVRTAFKKMYDDGLIYRGYRVINWDPKGQTTISDDEIVYETRKAKLYTFKYSKDIPISISTTRPETKLGDTAIAVHPDDARYQKYVGQEFTAIFAGEPITLKVIADQSVDSAFGTGALGVTPAHSMIDWEMAQRHGLPLKPVINEFAKMIVGAEGIKDKKASEAREAVVVWLRDQGLLEKEEEIEQNVSTAERTGGIIEPLPKLQWFIGVNKEFAQNGKQTTLKKLMLEAVSSGAVNMIPDRFESIYTHWIGNLRDWCISRQIWYGHRVPVWYKGAPEAPGEIYCGTEAPVGDGWMQDEDTLDTWFSSGLWTFSTLGWPDEKEFASNRQYHPTAVLETGRDIIFFWVARMILMSTYILGEVPFRNVYLHGLVLDGQGRKMSKSLGNYVDPLEVVAKYGADSYRMALVVGVGPGSDSKLADDKIKAYKLFSNKLWNVARFVLSSTEKTAFDLGFKAWSDIDTAHMNTLKALIAEVTREMDEYKFYLVAEKLYHYVWHEFADKILEESKTILTGADEAARVSRSQFLIHAFVAIIKLLHPFMPFVTEEIWKDMPIRKKSLLIVESWPE
ncbi:MAG: ValS [Candidatus Parcubacteria bacterium]|nr:ValS [Candidatus Parcubacteria bacterium]